MDKYKMINEEIQYPYDLEEFDDLMAKEVRVSCPCCGAVYNTLYRRRVYKSMLKALVLLYKGSRAAVPNSIGDFTKLAHFGLVERLEESGEWIITEYGCEFIAGIRPIPKYVYLRNNVPEAFSDEMVYYGEI